MWDQIRRTESTPPLYYVIARIPGAERGASNTVTFRVPDISAAYELADLVADVAAA